MALLKEDGSLDIKWINSLPRNEWRNLMGSLTDEQFEEYKKNCPLNEGINSVVTHKTNCTMEEEMRNEGLVRVSDVLNNIKKKYGL